MTSINCHCLNVTLPLVSPPVLTTDQKYISEQMGTRKIGEAKLKNAGPFMELENLVNTRIVSGWKVYKCYNCNIDVCAIDINNTSRALVNMDLDEHGVNDPRKLDKDGSRLYSPCFRIILEKTPASDALEASRDVQSIETFNKLQKQVDAYVSAEERQMEKRIRIFIKEQQEAFNELKSTANKDRALLWRTLCKVNETYGSTQNITLVSHNNPIPSPSPFKVAASAPSAVAPFPVNKFSSTTTPTRKPEVIPPKPAVPQPKPVTHKGFQVSTSSDGGIFSFDDDEDDTEASTFLQLNTNANRSIPAEVDSDDEDAKGDDSQYLATSLPVHILTGQPQPFRTGGRPRREAVIIKSVPVNVQTSEPEEIPKSAPRESWSSRASQRASITEEVPEELAASFAVPMSLNRRIKSLI